MLFFGSAQWNINAITTFRNRHICIYNNTSANFDTFFLFRLMEYEYYYNLQEPAARITYRYSKKKRDQQKSVSNLFVTSF